MDLNKKTCLVKHYMLIRELAGSTLGKSNDCMYLKESRRIYSLPPNRQPPL